MANQERRYPLRVYSRGHTIHLGKNDKKILQSCVFDEKNISIQASLTNERDFLSPSSLFLKNMDEYWLEVGFGKGDCLCHFMSMYPDIGFIGAEVYLKGIAQFLKKICFFNTDSNVRIFTKSVVHMLHYLEKESLDRILLLFPDPWPKKKHHKRRLIQQENLILIDQVLKKDGKLFVASDKDEYIEWTKSLLVFNKNFKLIEHYKNLAQNAPHDWFASKYQQKATLNERTSQLLIFQKAQF